MTKLLAMKDYTKAFNYCYTRLYNNSIPKAKWKDLVKAAKVNEHGQKEIPFMNYEITQEKLDKIIQDTIEVFKIDRFNQQAFKNGIYIGCSPKTKTN